MKNNFNWEVIFPSTVRLWTQLYRLKFVKLCPFLSLKRNWNLVSSSLFHMLNFIILQTPRITHVYVWVATIWIFKIGVDDSPPCSCGSSILQDILSYTFSNGYKSYYLIIYGNKNSTLNDFLYFLSAVHVYIAWEADSAHLRACPPLDRVCRLLSVALRQDTDKSTSGPLALSSITYGNAKSPLGR